MFYMYIYFNLLKAMSSFFDVKKTPSIYKTKNLIVKIYKIKWSDDFNLFFLLFFQSADTFRLQGLKQFKWKRRKLWEYLKIRRNEFYKMIELWRKCLKKIEGNFGTGVAAYFFFVKWLMFLNLTITVLIICFVVVPAVLMTDTDVDPCNSFNDTLARVCCIASYKSTSSNATVNPSSLIEGYYLIEGSGWLESTLMFYGIYPNSVQEGITLNYNLPFAYIATAVGYFLLSLCAIMKKAAHGFKDRLVESEGQYYRYCNMIFTGWDFCIYNESSAKIKHQAVYTEIKESLEVERRKDDRKNRIHEVNFKILWFRLWVNSFVITIFIIAGSFIFFTFRYSINELQKEFWRERNDLYRLLLEFFPYICIVGLNLIVPNILNYLVTVERYSPIFAFRITFFRTIILRLSTLVALLASFYSLVRCSDDQQNTLDYPNCSSFFCNRPMCWETYIGQQIYKLLILDILSNALITFLINFPRMLLAKHIKCKFTRILGAQEFELPKHVLDVVYSQTLVWFGSFYAPLLPALATVFFFLIFYIKKFACLVNSSPSTTIYRGSRSDSMFMSVLLVCFCFAVIPWAYSISELVPSKTCGPFRGRPSVRSVMEEVYHSLPSWITYSLESMASATFAIPAFVILLLTIYYFHIISNANKQMVEVLKKQLILEGHDKQFLLNRLSAFIKQHQERHKAVRSVDPPSNSN